MIPKLRLAAAAVSAAVLLAGGSFALSAAPPRSVEVQNGAATKMSPMHPVVWGGVRGSLGAVVTQLTSGECTGLGGTVNDVPKTKCDSGKGCVTAGADGVLHGVCIDEKVN